MDTLKSTGKNIPRAAAAALGICGLLLCLLPRPLTAGESAVRRFAGPGDFADWRGEGIEGGGPGPGGLQVWGGERFQLFSPSGLGIPAVDKVYLRIRLRIQSPRYFRVFWQDQGGRTVLPPAVIQPPLDHHLHAFWLPLAKENGRQGTIETLGLLFGGHPGWVEIESIEIRPFSTGLYLRDQWREFGLPRILGLGTINSLSGPRLFGKPFVSWLNILAATVIAVTVIFYFKAGKRGKNRLILKSALTLLLVWIVYDVRESFSQYQTMKEIRDSYVKPPPGEKTFPALGNFYGFVDLCQEVIPETAQYHFYSLPMWPFDCRIQYFLYPRGIKSSTWNRYLPREKTPYHAVYQDPGIRHDHATRRLIRQGEDGGSFISQPGKILSRSDVNSFIFLEDEVSR